MSVSTYVILGIVVLLVVLGVYSTVSFNRKCEREDREHELDESKEQNKK